MCRFAFSTIFLLLTSLAVAQPNTESPIKLGVLLPLSGGAAEQGEWSRRGIVLAERELKGELPLKLFYEDTKGEAALAISAYKRLRSEHEIQGVVTWGSTIAMAILPLANADKVIQMGVATATTDYRKEDDYNFRVYHSLAQEGEYLANHFQNTLKSERPALLGINNDYGVSTLREFTRSFNGQIAYQDVVEPRGVDFKSQILRLKRASPDSVLLAVYPAEGALLLRQLSELGVRTVKVAGGAILAGDGFFDLTGPGSAEGVQIIVPKVSGDEYQEFSDNYQSLFTAPVGFTGWYAARSYEGLKLLASALAGCNLIPSCAKDSLHRIRNYPGAFGNLSFDEFGDINSEFEMIVVKDGKFIRLGENQ